MSLPYPSTWPKPSVRYPDSLASRITEEQKLALYNREVTTRDLAKALNVLESTLSACFPGKVQSTAAARASKKELLATRKAFRTALAKRIIAGEISTMTAANNNKIPYRSMARVVQALKNKA